MQRRKQGDLICINQESRKKLTQKILLGSLEKAQTVLFENSGD
jgi:hypothetical protein